MHFPRRNILPIVAVISFCTALTQYDLLAVQESIKKKNNTRLMYFIDYRYL